MVEGAVVGRQQVFGERKPGRDPPGLGLEATTHALLVAASATVGAVLAPRRSALE
jgi:hypothetical protein